ncbi:MAG: DNA replication protein DnaC, partial [Tissierellia bacterium]|nr:DNA replication protein DnaC [Tissierellia bacterium]
MYKEILKEISIEYEKKRDKKLREQRLRRDKVYREIPAIKKIDEEIFKIGLNMSKNILNNPDKYKEVAERAKNTIEKLKMEKAYLMTESNIPMDYMDIKYDCDYCDDTGYLENGNQCNCLKQALVSRAYKMSNIENVLKKENFQTFNINVFKDEAFENEPLTPRENMKEIVGIAEGFVNNFNEDNGENLLFYGTTGLGKTFLCNCIAKSLLDKNKIVIYQTAFTIL